VLVGRVMAEPVPLDGTGGDGGAAPASSGFTFSTIASVFPPTDDSDLQLDRWRKVRVFVSAFLAEPALNVFNGCDMLDVEVLARALIAGVPREFWLDYLDCVQGVVFVWQFLLLMSDQMDASPALSRAVGELLFFACHTDAQALVLCEAKAGEDAKAFKQEWAEASVEKHEAWLMSQGVRDADTHVVAVGPSTVRIIEQSNELRSGQVWPGRKAVRAFLEDYTAERQRKKAADKRAADQAGGKKGGKRGGKGGTKAGKKKERKAWDEDDCRHHFPDNVLRAPRVLTFMCGWGYIVGFELLRETESPAHVVSSLAQRFVKLPRVVYFDTACQAQRNALRRVPWLLHQSLTAWFVDRFHRVGHNCSPVFNADQYPVLSQGHDTSGAERQHSIKKKYKNALTYMTQRRLIVRSRYIAAHNNIRLSQRRQARKLNAAGRLLGEAKTSNEIQHHPVETYFHWNIVEHCEREGCNCRAGEIGQGEAFGLETKW